MSDPATASIIAGLNEAQRNAVIASAVAVPAYRDGGALLDSLVELELAERKPHGAVLTQLGRRVRTDLKWPRK